MSDASGPISTLPGHISAHPNGAMCDMHNDRPAVCRIQGETDSFGAEFHDVCQECKDEIKKSYRDDKKGVCDWCVTEAIDLRNHRDIDEGLCGRVYRVCGECVRKENIRLEQELDGYYGN